MSETQFLSAIPVLASLDIQRSVDFFHRPRLFCSAC